MSDRLSLLIALLTNWNPAVKRSLLLCSAVILFGAAGFMWIEGWSTWRSLFFTLVTLTTVGYGDYGLTEAGQRFAAILMIGGIASVSYAATQLIQHATNLAMHPESRMIKQASKMSNHHIICGLGRTGQRVMRKLAVEGFETVAIDSNQTIIARLREEGFIVLDGDAADDHTLLAAGVKRAAAVAAVTSCDAANAMICLSARALAPNIAITARAEGDESIHKLRRAGASIVISPSRYGGDGVAQSMVRPELARLLFGDDEHNADSLQFAEFSITRQSPQLGRTISDFGADHPRIVFVAAKSNDGGLVMRPAPAHVLNEGDVLIIAGTTQDVANVGVAKLAA